MASINMLFLLQKQPYLARIILLLIGVKLV
jgi:hypothetical protein